MNYSLPMRFGLLPLGVVALLLTHSLAYAQTPPRDKVASPPPASPLASIDDMLAAEVEEENSLPLEATVTEEAALQEPTQNNMEESLEAYMQWKGSLMFSPKRVDDLLAIYYAYLEKMRNEEQDVDIEGDSDIAERTLRILTGAQEGEPTEEILSFTLNSILYDGPENWSIWVNGKRYNREQAIEGVVVDNSAIRVVAIDEHAITYEWLLAPQVFGFTEERWKARPDDEVVAKSPKVAKGSQVTLDSAEKKVVVTLRPNQTFLSQPMIVLEGNRRGEISQRYTAPQGDNAQSRDGAVTPGEPSSPASPASPASPGEPGEPGEPEVFMPESGPKH